MAGSVSWVSYITDEGEEYAIRHDLSNLAVTSQSTNPPPAGTLGLPRDYQVRYVNYRSADNVRSRKIAVLDFDETAPSELPDTISVQVFQGSTTQAVTLHKTFYRGEARSFPITTTDTGVNERGGGAGI